MTFQVAVCGPADCTPAEFDQAREIGALLAARRVPVICGGGSGVMAAVAAGVRSGGGIVIGVRPGPDRGDAGPDLTAVVATNMGEARNAIIVQSADAVIAVGGSWGTLSEVALAMRRGIPVIALGGWRVTGPDGTPIDGIRFVSTPAEAVDGLR